MKTLTILSFVTTAIWLGYALYRIYKLVQFKKRINKFRALLKEKIIKLDKDPTRRMILKIYFLDSKLNFEELLFAIDKLNLPFWALSCIPYLYAKDKQNNAIIKVWKKILDQLPEKEFKYVLLNDYCKGNILKIQLSDNFAAFDEIAIQLENVILKLPFSSEEAINGAINDELQNVELIKENQGYDELSKSIREKRKEQLCLV